MYTVRINRHRDVHAVVDDNSDIVTSRHSEGRFRVTNKVLWRALLVAQLNERCAPVD
jgi:hypothetical protein